MELEASGALAGFVGLAVPTWEAHFTPCVEISWRLGPARWGNGYATEAALAFAFERLGLREVVSFTVAANARSRRVMERIGMVHDPADDFNHPLLPEGHPLRRHVLYRITGRQRRQIRGSDSGRRSPHAATAMETGKAAASAACAPDQETSGPSVRRPASLAAEHEQTTMEHEISREDERFRAEFEVCTVPPAEFDHQVHVLLAYIYLAGNTPEAASARMRESLLRFLRHHCIKASKYHETLTRVWILAVRHFMKSSPPTRSADAFIEGNLALLDRKIMMTHYSAERLSSVEGRGAFVKPDIAPFPSHDP